MGSFPAFPSMPKGFDPLEEILPFLRGEEELPACQEEGGFCQRSGEEEPEGGGGEEKAREGAGSQGEEYQEREGEEESGHPVAQGHAHQMSGKEDSSPGAEGRADKCSVSNGIDPRPGENEKPGDGEGENEKASQHGLIKGDLALGIHCHHVSRGSLVNDCNPQDAPAEAHGILGRGLEPILD